MRKTKLALLALTAALAVTACGGKKEEKKPETVSAAETQATEATEATEATTLAPATDEEKAKAAEVGKKIDAIYVQNWSEDTEKLCKEAKEAWDALSDSAKAEVKGEHASPEYFGLDTGDVTKDNPLNQDEIGEKEILVVSFGTSYNDSRAKDIGGIESYLAKQFPDYSVRRAFTSQIIMNHILARDGEKIDNVEQALERAKKNGVKELIVQPTHLMQGKEYDELKETLDKHKADFAKVALAEPLLGEVGKDAEEINADKEQVATLLVQAAVTDGGFDSVQKAGQEGAAFVFLGHGTSHTAAITYSEMQTAMRKLGYNNVFIGTVEGEPAETAVDAVIEAVKKAGFKKVTLRPMMVVAGDHAHNDMAGAEEDSWVQKFVASKNFDRVETQILGLGGIADIEKIYAAHTQAAIDQAEGKTAESGAAETTAAESKAN
ncbi:sirohydrochlorin cobaltochelatase [Stomatobaculum longum]|uniref:sirohydrochlorin cobaltochelatase n=1 Tax=Stomatobaculum longum TaxID=796942 RepID=UPI003C774F8F